MALIASVLGFGPERASAAASTVDLRVLIIAVGGPEVDPGLDMMDDLLDELGVPYDVLDSSTIDLTPALLSSGDHGNYNGIIVTVADTYLPSVGGAGLSPAEWEVLHDYERAFDVNEAVIAGFPTTGGTPNYGMVNVVNATGTVGAWTGAAEAEVFSYVNTSNPISVTDFGFSAAPRGAAGDPVVTPYLNDTLTPGNALLSHLAYDDGREVLLSTVTNAWFLEYSQVFAYGFLDFATSGLHLGGRRAHLAAHVDDLFLSADMWDPVANETVFDNPYRNTPADIVATVNAQDAFNSTFATVDGFKADLAFNGFGVMTGEPGTLEAAAAGDTYIDVRSPSENFAANNRARIRSHQRRERARQALLGFTLPADTTGWQQALLALRTSTPRGLPVDAEVCPVTEPWTAAEATWVDASAGTPWSTGGGAPMDDSLCVGATFATGTFTVDVSPIVTAWLGGTPNFGLGIRTAGTNRVNVWTAETNSAPELELQLGGSGDPLVDAVQANASSFRFLNHTFNHRDMDTSAGTTAAQATEEIELNRQVWATLGLPEATENANVVVTGNHSGLEDDNGTELDPSDDILYPAGINQQMIAGFDAAGIQFVASDTSRVNTGTEQYIPGSNMVLLPRYPTAVFYNTTTPEQLVDEYNYIFHERYVDAGQDPCVIPGALCTPRDYQEILAAEADTAVRHILSYRRFPHYFHIANLVDYDGQGSTLLSDWLDAVATEYESRVDLPIVNLPYYAIGDRTQQALLADSATIDAVLNLQTREVTLTSSTPLNLTVTGITGGAPYGGKLLAGLSLDATPVVVTAEP